MVVLFDIQMCDCQKKEKDVKYKCFISTFDLLTGRTYNNI